MDDIEEKQHRTKWKAEETFPEKDVQLEANSQYTSQHGKTV